MFAGSALEAAAAALAAPGSVVLPLVHDVTDRRQWAACAARVRGELGGVDLLCSNAGVNFVGPMQAGDVRGLGLCARG